MKEIALLGVTIILAFIVFVIFWNKKWQGKILDEREANLRLKVRMLISRAIEICLVIAIGFHFVIRPLTGLEALTTIGITGVLSEAFGNWFFRKDDIAV